MSVAVLSTGDAKVNRRLIATEDKETLIDSVSCENRQSNSQIGVRKSSLKEAGADFPPGTLGRWQSMQINSQKTNCYVKCPGHRRE